MLTGILDVDFNIMSFCDPETIENLIKINKKLVEKAIPMIIFGYLDFPNELAEFTIDLIDTKEIELAKIFIINTLNLSKGEEDFN